MITWLTYEPKQRRTEDRVRGKNIFWLRVYYVNIVKFSNFSDYFSTKENSEHGSYLSWSPWRNYTVFLCELRHCFDESIGTNFHGKYGNIVINSAVVQTILDCFFFTGNQHVAGKIDADFSLALCHQCTWESMRKSEVNSINFTFRVCFICDLHTFH